jgi:dihydroorotate dehydrogenase (NAD+) catalytic subunit
MGGISSGRDALEYLITGAKAVEVGTANFIDPEASIKIIEELKDYCEENGIERIEDVIGTIKR